MSERERLARIMKDMARGRDIGHKLRFDPRDKRLKPTYDGSLSWLLDKDPDRSLTMTNRDADLFAPESETEGQIVISMEALSDLANREMISLTFMARPAELVFTHLGAEARPGYDSVPGSILMAERPAECSPESFDQDQDWVRVIVSRNIFTSKASPRQIRESCRGFIRRGEGWRRAKVQVVPVAEELYSRFGGLLETDALAGKRVSIFGLGSGGSPIANELTKAGVTKSSLVDHDRLEVGNLVRHHCGLSDVGRLKVLAVADAIREKNPYAEISVFPVMVSHDTLEVVEPIVADSDLVVVATDNQPSKLLLNRLIVKHGRPAIFAGAHRRAYGGQVLRIRPGETCCYQCFVMLLPEPARDQEISSPRQAEGLAYTDRPVAIEPGLSNDIAPIAQMAVKLAIQELLRGRSSTLASLDEDLKAPWYLWLNRREVGTQYEGLQPLEYNLNGMFIMRWYGIDIGRHAGCPVCGEFTAASAAKSMSPILEATRSMLESARRGQ